MKVLTLTIKTQFHSILPDYINYQTEACNITNIVQQMNIFFYFGGNSLLIVFGYTALPPCGFRIPIYPHGYSILNFQQS